MSGGSFNYVSTGGIAHVLSMLGTVHDLSAALAEYPDSQLAVIATGAWLARVETLRVELERLQVVWKAVEWHRSMDWGADDVAGALAAFATLPRHVEYEAAQRHARTALERLPGGADAWPMLRVVTACAVAAALAEARDAAK